MITKERIDAVWAAAFVRGMDEVESTDDGPADTHRCIGECVAVADKVVAALKDWAEVES